MRPWSSGVNVRRVLPASRLPKEHLTCEQLQQKCCSLLLVFQLVVFYGLSRVDRVPIQLYTVRAAHLRVQSKQVGNSLYGTHVPVDDDFVHDFVRHRELLCQHGDKQEHIARPTGDLIRILNIVLIL